jgi:hypothetical protein
MNEIDKQGRTANATATFPAIIQIQAGALSSAHLAYGKAAHHQAARPSGSQSLGLILMAAGDRGIHDETTSHGYGSECSTHRRTFGRANRNGEMAIFPGRPNPWEWQRLFGQAS